MDAILANCFTKLPRIGKIDSRTARGFTSKLECLISFCLCVAARQNIVFCEEFPLTNHQSRSLQSLLAAATTRSSPSFVAMETPTVSVFCATFLKPEMWHVYRQVVGPTGLKITVHAFKRENADRFPYPDLFLVPRSPYRWVRRVWHVQIWHSPQLALPSECRGLLHSLIK